MAELQEAIDRDQESDQEQSFHGSFVTPAHRKARPSSHGSGGARSYGDPIRRLQGGHTPVEDLRTVPRSLVGGLPTPSDVSYRLPRRMAEIGLIGVGERRLAECDLFGVGGRCEGVGMFADIGSPLIPGSVSVHFPASISWIHTCTTMYAHARARKCT